MTKLLFHTETTYERTSDEWKEHVHTRSYYLDQSNGKITCHTIVEFQDTRSSTSLKTGDETVEIARSRLSRAARAKLAEFE